VAAAVCEAAAKDGQAVFTCWPGGDVAGEARAVARAGGLPAYTTPEKAIGVFLGVAQYRRLRDLLLELPPSEAVDFEPDRHKAAGIIGKALEAGRSQLSEGEACALLGAYGIAMPEASVVRSGAQALRTAAALGFPVTLRALASDAGAPAAADLGARQLDSEAELADAIKQLRRELKRRSATARIVGFSLRRSDARPGAQRWMAAVVPDAVFGPVMVFGESSAAASRRERAAALPPLNMALAHDLIGSVQHEQAVPETQERIAATDAALARALVGLSQLISDFDEIAELELNPLCADAEGVLVLDASIRLAAPARRRGAQRFSVRPYPRELERQLVWRGRPVLVRAIRPDDEAALAELLESLPPQDMRSRFFSPIEHVPRSQLARFTQIDYDREMALVVVDESAEHPGACSPKRGWWWRRKTTAPSSPSACGPSWRGRAWAACCSGC
jgi:acetyltransferase